MPLDRKSRVRKASRKKVVAKPKVTGNACSVPGCPHYSSKEKYLHFYSFPSRPWQIDQRNQWIDIINRRNPDGTQWVPTPNSKICSAHFVGGEKSLHPHSPSFLPTIFPCKYKALNESIAKLCAKSSSESTRKDSLKDDVEELTDIDSALAMVEVIHENQQEAVLKLEEIDNHSESDL